MSLSSLTILAFTGAALIVAGLVGKTRRLGFWLTLVLSIFLTPFVGVALAVLTGPRRWPGRSEIQAKLRRARRRRLLARQRSGEEAVP